MTNPAESADNFKSGMDAYLMDKQPGGVNLFNHPAESAETWHFLDKRSKAIAYRGVKLEFASHSDAVLGKAVLGALESKAAALESKHNCPCEFKLHGKAHEFGSHHEPQCFWYSGPYWGDLQRQNLSLQAALVFTENEMQRYAGLLGAEVSKHKQTQAALDSYERLVAPLPDEQKAIVEAAMAFIKHEADMLRRATKAEAALDAVAAERDKAWRDLSSCAAEYEMYGSPEAWQNRYLTSQAALDAELAKVGMEGHSLAELIAHHRANAALAAAFDVVGLQAALDAALKALREIAAARPPDGVTDIQTRARNAIAQAGPARR